MKQESGKIKVSIDESDLKRLIQAADDAAEKILKHGAFPQSGLDLSSDFNNTANKLQEKQTLKGTKENTGEDKKIEELTKKMLGDFEGMLDKTQKMLQTVGLIDSEIGKIFQMIIQLVNSLSKGFDFGKSIIGFFSNLFAPGSGMILDGMAGQAGNRLLSSSGGMYPVNAGLNRVVYVVPRDTVIRGRDIYTSWAIEEKINSNVSL